MGVVRRVAVAVAGTALIVVGVVLLVLPGPGLVLIAAGLALLATEFPWAARALAWVRLRAKSGFRWLRRKNSDRGISMRVNRQETPARTLGQATQQFWSYSSPRILGVWLLVAVTVLVVTVATAEWTWWALAGAVVVALVQPFLEWFLHILVLHDRPLQVGNRVFDTVVASDHRKHHADPRYVPLVFIPRRWVGYLIATTVAVYGLVFVHFGAATAAVVLVAQALAALGYEWTHFYIHSDAPANNRYIKMVRRIHRNHHYRNPDHWLGITSPVADILFRTYSEPRETPVVPHAKDLIHAPIPEPPR